MRDQTSEAVEFCFEHEMAKPCGVCRRNKHCERHETTKPCALCAQEAKDREHRGKVVKLIEESDIPWRFLRHGCEPDVDPPRLLVAPSDSASRRDLLEKYDTETESQRRAKAVSQRYVDDFAKNVVGRSLMFVGKVGTGKTHLACGILHAVAGQRYSVKYTTAAKVIRDIRATWRQGSVLSEEHVLEKLTGVHLLVIDEVGVQTGSDDERMRLGELIDLRYQSASPTLVIGNCDLAGLARFLGERSVDRLCDAGGETVVFDWNSYRR